MVNGTRTGQAQRLMNQRMNWTRVALALALSIVLAGCGSDSSGGADAGAGPDGARADANRGLDATGDGADPCPCDAPPTPARVTGVTSATATVSVGRQMALTVTLDAPAAGGGQVVTLASSAPGVASTDASVRVLEAERTATFLVTGVSPSPPSGGLVTISATGGGATASTGVLVLTGEPSAVDLDGVSELVLAGTGVATVTISRPADHGGQRVDLSSFAESTIVPPSVTVPAGAVVATFGLRGGAGTGTSVVTAVTTSGIAVPMSVTTTVTARAPGTGELVVNEALSDPPGSAATDLVGDANCDGARGDADELIELYNWMQVPLQLAGVSLWDSTFDSPGALGTPTRRMTFPAHVLGPGEAIVIFPASIGTTGTSPWCAGVTASRIGDSVVFTGGGFALDDERDRIALRVSDAPDSLVVTGFSLVPGFARDQSVTLVPDGGEIYSDYLIAPGHATDRAFSPGTRLDGRPWASVRP